jgi:hypothetical protein
MIRVAMLLPLAAVALGSHPIVALADEVPNFDVRATCRAESVDDPSGGPAASCLADEQQAHATLVAQWAQFSSESRASCVDEQAETPSQRSYVELLTCLQIAKEVKDLPKE